MSGLWGEWEVITSGAWIWSCWRGLMAMVGLGIFNCKYGSW